VPSFGYPDLAVGTHSTILVAALRQTLGTMIMSMDAELVVLFEEVIDEQQAAAVRGLAGLESLTLIDDADLHAWVSPDGELDFVASGRSGPLMGEPLLQGRLWHAYLGSRFWTDALRDYGGDPSVCRRSVEALRAQSVAAVAHVWYGTRLLGDDSKGLSPVDVKTFV
jgi:hypothetical protein